MRFIPIDRIKPGMILGKTIYDSSGTNILSDNQVLTSELLARIQALGYTGLYIEDEISSDIEIKDAISSQLRNQAIQSLKNMFVSSSGGDASALQDEINFLRETLEQVIDEIINTEDLIVNLVDLKIYDDYTYFHSVNVAILSLIVGQALKLPSTLLTELGIAAMLHDIGKKFVPIELLQKPGALSDEEFAIVREHPTLGANFIRKYYPTISELSCSGIMQHHERFDGTGYPNGLYKDDISIFGRILAVCDVYDALVSKRPYHQPYLPSNALEFLHGGSGTMFDSNVVMAFSRKIATYPIGQTVTLSNGETGIVIKNYEGYNTRPKLKIIKNGVVTRYLDLKSDYEARSITIVAVDETL